MLEKPNLTDEAIIAGLRENFGLRVAQVVFLPIGWVNNALYRVTACEGTAYFLKLRCSEFNAAAVAVPAFLHAQGIKPVLAPLATTSHDLWFSAHGFAWTLYPFFAGKTGFEVALSKRQWAILGESMHAIHTTPLPTLLAALIPHEDFAPSWHQRVTAFHHRVEQERFADPIAAQFAAFWQTKQNEIERIVERASQLALALAQRTTNFVVCHTDLHGRNVLVSADDELTIVDWDEPMLAPKERDLMFIGGGIGGIWNTEQETAWFYQGYGQAPIDLVALSYYRYARIVVDIAEIAERIFGMHGSPEEREKGLGLVHQFLPNNVVAIAHRTYEQLACGE